MPALFGRVAAAFEEASHVVLRPCHEIPGELTNLQGLVEGFLEMDGWEDTERVSDESVSSDTETTRRLRGLLRRGNGDMGGGDAVSDNVQQRMRPEVEAACGVLVGDPGSDDFKRQLMVRLRERGFDAGFCKSKWEKTSGFPPGEYSFVDVNVHGVRYFVDTDLSRQFEMARCTEQYRLLLNMIPQVFVGRGEELKHLVRIMCSAQKRSMKKMDLHIPPWRRKGYVLSKWFGPQERSTTDGIRARDQAPRDRGYISYYCREDSSRRGSLGVGIGYTNSTIAGARGGMRIT
ncbi:hypothetical protein MLD38_036798 [Melastoma candidum]|uniref:Uncharacterized protein n=1 Tax=Melastoma candidum TaxID=119954 RepID=A0ACB9LKT9_9MYRT|nr:hypothetical protein MLD38_036798 [Melastoma candidum]